MSSFVVNSDRKPASFSHTSKQPKSSARNQPLTREFFSYLIKLETEFHNKTYTVTTLDQLIQYYAQAVEYYDKAKDEIAGYFIFKIQDILATKKSLKMLLDQNIKSSDKRDSNSSVNEHNENNETATSSMGQKSTNNPKQIVYENILEENSEEEEDDDREEIQVQFQKKRQEARSIRKNRTSISTMKNQKQRFVNFFYKMETQKANEKQNMHLVLNEFNSTCHKNDPFVKRDLENQKHHLRRRVERRKAEVFMSYTVNTQSSHVGNDNLEKKENDTMFENLLDGLDVDQFGEEDLQEESSYTDRGSLSDRASGKENQFKMRKNLQIETQDEDTDSNSAQQSFTKLASPRSNNYFSPRADFYKSPGLSSNPLTNRKFKLGNE